MTTQGHAVMRVEHEREHVHPHQQVEKRATSSDDESQPHQPHEPPHYSLLTRRALVAIAASRSKRSSMSRTLNWQMITLCLLLALLSLRFHTISAQLLPSLSAPPLPDFPALGSAPAAPGTLPPPLPGGGAGSSGAAGSTGAAGDNGSTGGSTSALSTIAFSKDTYTVAANDTVVSIVLLRLGGIDGATSINFTTNDVTAVSGIDYGGGSGFVTWLDGDVDAKVVQIAIERTQPWASAAPYKRFLLLLYNPINAYLGYPNIVTVDILPTPDASPASSSTGGGDIASTGGATTGSSSGGGGSGSSTGATGDESSTATVLAGDDSSRSGTDWQLALGLGLGLGGGGLIILMAMTYGVFQHRKRQRAMQHQVMPAGSGGGGGAGAAGGAGAVRMGGAIPSMSRAPSGAGAAASGRPSINASASGAAAPNSVIRSANGGDAAVVIRSA